MGILYVKKGHIMQKYYKNRWLFRESKQNAVNKKILKSYNIKIYFYEEKNLLTKKKSIKAV